MKTTIILVSLVICISGCCHSSSAKTQEEKLVGTWELDLGDTKAAVTYSKDHTYVASIQGIVAGTSAGKWRIDGDNLVENIEKCTLNEKIEGTEMRETIVNLGATVLVIKESESQVNTYKRLL